MPAEGTLAEFRVFLNTCWLVLASPLVLCIVIVCRGKNILVLGFAFQVYLWRGPTIVRIV